MSLPERARIRIVIEAELDVSALTVMFDAAKRATPRDGRMTFSINDGPAPEDGSRPNHADGSTR